MACPASWRRIIRHHSAIAAFDFEHLRQLEPREPRMRQIEGNRDARNAVGREPLVRQPVVRPHQPAAVELLVDLRDARLDNGSRDRQPEVAHPDVEQLLVGERRPVDRGYAFDGACFDHVVTRS